MNSLFRTLCLLSLAVGGSYLMVRHIENQVTLNTYFSGIEPVSFPEEITNVCMAPERTTCSLREVYPTNNFHLLDGSFIYHLVLDCHNSTHSWETTIPV